VCVERVGRKIHVGCYHIGRESRRARSARLPGLSCRTGAEAPVRSLPRLPPAPRLGDAADRSVGASQPDRSGGRQRRAVRRGGNAGGPDAALGTAASALRGCATAHAGPAGTVPAPLPGRRIGRRDRAQNRQAGEKEEYRKTMVSYNMQYTIKKAITFAKIIAACGVVVVVGVVPTFSQSTRSKAALNMALLKAAGHNRGAEVKSLLAQGADPNVKLSNGYTPIMLLALHPNLDAAAIQALQKAGGDINAVDGLGDTALEHAARNGAVSEVRVLLARGAKVDIVDAGGNTALMTAAFSGWDDIVQLLLDHSAKVNTQNRYGQTALFLTTNGPHGPSALAQKSYTRRVKVIQMLLNKDANVNLKAKNLSMYSPLMMAAYYENVEMVRALLKKHADVTARDAKGRTVLQIAMRHNQSQEIIQLLKKAGAKEGSAPQVP
jgi:ankyrin repeat protein